MLRIETTHRFDEWFAGLHDRQLRVRVQVRVDRLAMGNPGQHRTLAGGIAEMKIDFGPGYRVHYTQLGALLVVLLCGGDKGSQQQDIAAAQALAKQLE